MIEMCLSKGWHTSVVAYQVYCPSWSKHDRNTARTVSMVRAKQSRILGLASDVHVILGYSRVTIRRVRQPAYVSLII